MEEAKERASLVDDRSGHSLLKQAVDALAAVCDGASSRDKVGYNGTDTKYGHLLAFLDLEDWPPESLHRAWQMLRKYRDQLAGLGIDYFALPEPPNCDGQDRQISFHEATGDFVVVFPYDLLLVSEFRQLPGEDFQRTPVPHRLIHPVAGAGVALLTFAERHQFVLRPGVQERLCADSPNMLADHRFRAILEGGNIALYFPRDQRLNAEAMAIPRRMVSHDGGFHWLIPPLPPSLEALHTFFERHPQFALAAEVEQILQQFAPSDLPSPRLPRW